MPAYDETPAHRFLAMLDPATGGLAPGDPAHMAARIIESVDTEPLRTGQGRSSTLIASRWSMAR